MTLHVDNEDTSIGYKSPKEALTEYLNASQYVVDGCKYRVDEVCKNGVTLAYALRYNQYLNEWSFLHSRSFKSDIPSPIGLCIEGIRVEFSTPGFDGESIIAVANAHNCSFVLTNVARSAIEENGRKEDFLQILYSCYAEHIQSQMKILRAERSLDWAVTEFKYLMTPLLEHSSNGVQLQSRESFFQTFDQLESIVIEANGERKAASAKDVERLENICIVDSVMVSAATMLLRGVQSTSTLSNLVKVVDPGINLPSDIPMICGYDDLNALHRRALRGKQASSIVVSKQHRRVDIQFSYGIHNWNIYNTSATTIHVPVVDIDIQGLSDEFGVYTTNGIYLSYKNTFTQYLRELLKEFDYEHSPKDKQLVNVLLSIACNERLLDIKPNAKNQYDNDSLFRNVTRNIAPYSDLL